MITSKKRKRVTVSDKFVGGEPIIEGSPGTSQLAKALSWYNYSYDPKIAKGYLVEYMKANGYSKEDVSKIKACPDSVIGVTATSLARLVTNGMVIKEAHLDFLRGVIQDGIDYETKTPTVEKDPNDKVVSIRERIEAKANQVLTDFDNAVDVVLKPKQFSFFDGYNAGSVKMQDIIAKAMKHANWAKAKELALVGMQGKLQDITDGATHYHVTSGPGKVKPKWSNPQFGGKNPQALATNTIGRHTFFKNIR